MDKLPNAQIAELIIKWRKKALATVPPEYADRQMHDKYLRLDNWAAGLDEAADELEDLLLGKVKHD